VVLVDEGLVDELDSVEVVVEVLTVEADVEEAVLVVDSDVLVLLEELVELVSELAIDLVVLLVELVNVLVLLKTLVLDDVL